MRSDRRGGDDVLLSKKEAAQHLGVPFKALRPLVKQGILEPIKSAGSTWFYLSDVNNAATVLAKKLDVATANRMAVRALAMSTRLERMMSSLMFMLGANKEPEPLTPERIFEDWQIVMDNVHRKFDDIEVPEILNWARFFFAVDEAYLLLAQATVTHKEPWLPYLAVSDSILKTLSGDMSTEKKAALEYLRIARRSMRQAAYFICRKKFGVTRANRFFPDSRDADLTNSLLAILEAGSNKEQTIL